jgi:hypothetical protein
MYAVYVLALGHSHLFIPFVPVSSREPANFAGPQALKGVDRHATPSAGL